MTLRKESLASRSLLFFSNSSIEFLKIFELKIKFFTSFYIAEIYLKLQLNPWL